MTVVWIAAILGIVEGLTEFLPISSTGHLIVVGHLLGFRGDAADTFDIFIQLGAILAVVVYYRSWLYETAAAALFRAGRGSEDTRQARRVLLGILLAVLPAMVAGAGLHGVIKRHLFQSWTVAVGLIAGGVAIFLVERWRPVDRVRDLTRVTLRQALGIGLGQCFALWPGVSRSGATILSGLSLGLDHPTAAAFSFLLSVPTMTAAVTFDLLKSWHGLSIGDLAAMGVGFAVSFVVAWGVIAGFLQFLRTHSLKAFGWYRIGIGLLILWLHIGGDP